MYAFAIVLVIAGSLLYHVSSRSIDPRVGAAPALVLTYAIAVIVVSAVTLIVDRDLTRVAAATVRRAGWPAAGLALGAVLIEFGYVLAYRQGGKLSTASIGATVASSALLAAGGAIWFGERISIRIAVGIVIAVLAVVLLLAE